MPKHNKKEKELIRKVNEFRKKNNVTMYAIGKGVGYYNIEKLDDFFNRGIGSLTMRVAGMIEEFISIKN